MIDEITISRYYELKDSKIRQLSTINNLINTINIINLIKINRIFNDEIFQIFIIMSNHIFIKIIKISIVQIKIILILSKF